MRVVIQRVLNAAVTIDGHLHSQIEVGLLLLAGFEEADTEKDLQWMCDKICQMRIFSDADGKMNLSVMDVKGELLVVSQFTLHASTKKGNRPSFIKAARPEQAIPLYHKFIELLEAKTSKPIRTGVFGADMKVSLVNDGPVTIIIDSKQPE
jgi:D-tyrosyl-tRNA(Tyr) deacylase